MLLDWSPTWDTHPQITSSTTSGSTPARSSSSFRTTADRSAACMPDNPPLRFPTAVRTASTMTVSRMYLLRLLRSWYRPPTSKRRLASLGESGIGGRGVRGREIADLRAGLVRQGVAQRAVGALVQQRLGLGERDGRTGRQPGRQLL